MQPYDGFDMLIDRHVPTLFAHSRQLGRGSIGGGIKGG